MPLLEARSIAKRYPGVTALGGVSLALDCGEVLALVGENGAGKSTLMKILAGVERPDSGTLAVNGSEIRFDSPQDALDAGIALIHQELNLCDNLDIGANIFLGREPKRYGLIDGGEISRRSEALLKRLGCVRRASTPVAELSIAERQLVEIAKALSTDARVIIMDEPTSSLTARETERLLGLISELKQRGIAVIYISHRLDEVERIADRALVLRDGSLRGELVRGHITRDALIPLMVGRALDHVFPAPPERSHPPLLEVRGLRTPRHPAPISFTVGGGEIVGIAGLIGSGRTELLEALAGAAPSPAGAVRLHGTALTAATLSARAACGIVLVPEDRRAAGIVGPMSIRENATLHALPSLSNAGVISRRAERACAGRVREQLGIRCSSVEQRVATLSGGNQQKTVIGKWMAGKAPAVLLLDEPTRGVDIGAREELYRLIRELADDGLGVLWVSSELEELLGMCDRIMVMHEGRVSGELPRAVATEEAVMHLATGAAAAP